MSKTECDYISIDDQDRVAVHVFVEPQDLVGIDIGYVDLDEESSKKLIAGDIFIGNEENGYYTVSFELHKNESGAICQFDFGEDEYDLAKGACFLIKQGYEISQLPYFSKEDAEKTFCENE